MLHNVSDFRAWESRVWESSVLGAPLVLGVVPEADPTVSRRRGLFKLGRMYPSAAFSGLSPGSKFLPNPTLLEEISSTPAVKKPQ